MTDDRVAEYLREVETRLGGLPALRRREVLSDLRLHIASEKVELGVSSAGEIQAILERLGRPEEVAAAAYEEAGSRTTIRPADVGAPARSRLLTGAGIVAAVLFALIVAAVFFGTSSTGGVTGAVTPTP